MSHTNLKNFSIVKVLFEIEVISFIEANAYDSFELSSEEQRKKLTLDQILQICNCLREVTKLLQNKYVQK